VDVPLPPRDPRDIKRVAFLGTPEVAVPPLRSLNAAGYDVALIVTGADKRRGRGRSTSPTPVKSAAIELGLQVTTNIDDLLDVHAEAPIDVAVVVAYGRLIRMNVLTEIPMVNIHFSKLPRWRGAAPVERALLAGDESTAVSIMTVAEALDEGDVWASQDVRIESEDTVESLWDSMSRIGASLLIDTMSNGFTDASPQGGEGTYAKKLATEDLRLDWSRSAVTLDRIVRVGDAWTSFRGERFKIHEVRVYESFPDGRPSGVGVSHGAGVIDGLMVDTGEGRLELLVVQPAGKPRMSAGDWANGARPDGERLGG